MHYREYQSKPVPGLRPRTQKTTKPKKGSGSHHNGMQAETYTHKREQTTRHCKHHTQARQQCTTPHIKGTQHTQYTHTRTLQSHATDIHTTYTNTLLTPCYSCTSDAHVCNPLHLMLPHAHSLTTLPTFVGLETAQAFDQMNTRNASRQYTVRVTIMKTTAKPQLPWPAS